MVVIAEAITIHAVAATTHTLHTVDTDMAADMAIVQQSF